MRCPARSLARRGHLVTGLDSSAVLLADLGRSLRAEPPEVQDRPPGPGDALRAAELSEPEGSDAVLCHGVLMYLPDPGPLLAAIAAVTVRGGLVSRPAPVASAAQAAVAVNQLPIDPAAVRGA